MIVTWHKINCSWNSVLGGIYFIQKCQIPKIKFDPPPPSGSVCLGAPQFLKETSEKKITWNFKFLKLIFSENVFKDKN
jgi:hypothetical protein